MTQGGDMGKKILNVLYFTLEDFESIKDGHSINKDLLREFQRHGHNIYAVSPTERRRGLPTRLIRGEDDKSNESNKCYECDDCGKNDKHAKHGRNSKNGSVVILKPRIGNIQKTKNFIEKGISTVTIGWILKQAIKKYLNEVKFDLIIYCTPPITFLYAIRYVKKRDGARTYLLLKDIFPQNAVDLGMFSTTGLKGILYQYFRKQEKKLYAISDSIGCMSPANLEYVQKHNQEIKREKVEVCPNCIELEELESIDELDKKLFDEKTGIETGIEARTTIRKKYGLPVNKKIFIYGGNLGKPQGIPFLIKCLRACTELDCYFLIVGDGTEKHLLVEYMEEKQAKQPKNIKLIEQLPQDEYTQLVSACDVGLIF